jgi:hypothetical protein
MAFHAEAMSELHEIDTCPIHCSDDALMWLDQVGGRVSFVAHVCEVKAGDAVARRRVGFGGFDARGTLMMTCRDVWRMVNA